MTLGSLVKLLCVGLNTVVVSPMIVLVAWFDERAGYRVCQGWVRANLLTSGVRVRTHPLATLDPSTPYVFMSNHRSHFDVLAAIAALPEFQLRWVAKKELTRVPIFGWALRHTGHVIIDRSDTAQAVASLRAAEARMRDGISVIIFPEGTRSPDGASLLPFKKGGFMLALETGVPIVPLAISGSERVLPKSSWWIRSGTIDVAVGAPIPVAGVDRDELVRRVRAFMDDQLDVAHAAPQGAPVPAEAT